MTRPTTGSKVRRLSPKEMPRIEALILPPDVGSDSIVTLGIDDPSSAIDEICADSIWSGVRAVIAAGTSCKFSDRRRAVTTLSCNPPEVVSTASADAGSAGAVWAEFGVAKQSYPTAPAHTHSTYNPSYP